MVAVKANQSELELKDIGEVDPDLVDELVHRLRNPDTEEGTDLEPDRRDQGEDRRGRTHSKTCALTLLTVNSLKC